MLKGIIKITQVSTIWWFYHYLISLPIFLIRDWMLCNTKTKLQEKPNKNIQWQNHKIGTCKMKQQNNSKRKKIKD